MAGTSAGPDARLALDYRNISDRGAREARRQRPQANTREVGKRDHNGAAIGQLFSARSALLRRLTTPSYFPNDGGPGHCPGQPRQTLRPLIGATVGQGL